MDGATIFCHSPIKCLDLWFESGDVVVVAGHVGFRVHSDVLSDGSSVLADLLNGSAAAVGSDEPENELDGCPVIRLDDSVHDVKHLLRLLYDGMDMDQNIEPIREVEFSDLTSDARMAHKYKLHVRKEVYCRLRQRFPSTFAEWESRGSLSAEDAIEVITLFRTIGDDDTTTAHMVVTLYLCCSLPYRALLRGNSRRDGVLARLDEDDVERCVLLRELLVERSAWMAARLFEGRASIDCVGADGQCDTRIAEVRTTILHGDSDGDTDDWLRPDPLGEFAQSRIDEMELEGVERGICGICAGMLCERDRELRRELWEEMPRLLGRVSEEMAGARHESDEDEE